MHKTDMVVHHHSNKITSSLSSRHRIEVRNERRGRGVRLSSAQLWQHSSEETSPQWRAFGDIASLLIDPGIKASLPAPITIFLIATPEGKR